jgi:hypothetical protein
MTCGHAFRFPNAEDDQQDRDERRNDSQPRLMSLASQNMSNIANDGPRNAPTVSID